MMIKLMTYNILVGGKGREAQIFETIEANQPDIVLLQELDNPGLLSDLATRLNMHCFWAKANLQLLRAAPGVKLGRRNIGLLSRFPIVSAASFRSFPLRRTLLEATIEYRPGERLTLFGVHLKAELAVTAELWRRWEVATILGRVAKRQTERCLIAGDFNTIGKDDRVLSQKFPLKMRIGLALQGGKIYRWAIPKMVEAGFQDCYRALHPIEDGFTLPTTNPNTRLDYIFAGPSLAQFLRGCEVVKNPACVQQASDHYPVLAEFELL